MTIQVRPVSGDDEQQGFLRVVAAAFGDQWTPPSEERRAIDDRLRRRERTLVVVEGGRIRGGCFSYDLELTLPGGRAVPVAGLAGVGVDPTQTGRGLLRHLVDGELAESRERGEVASALLASESGLYRRFGYGQATSMAVYEATSSAARLREPLEDGGCLELVTDHDARRAAARDVYAELARHQAGTTSRSEAWWDAVFATEASWLGGGPQLVVVHRAADGRPDGYLLYTVDSSGGAGHWVADGTVAVRELVGLDLGVELALWQHATGVALTRRVRLELAPVDLRLRWHLADPRQLRTVALHDLLWVRPLDVARFLGARSYAAEGRVAVHVDQPDDREVHGAWTIDAGGGGADVARGGRPGVRLPLPALATAAMGEASVVELWRAGLVAGEAHDVRQLSALLATEDRPFCFSKF